MEETYYVDIERLITLVHDRPVIWDKSLEEHRLRAETEAAWREICCDLDPLFESLSDEEKAKYRKFLSIKWTNIRDRYMKYLKKLTVEKTTGSRSKLVKKYIYCDQLSFLQKNMKRARTVSSEHHTKDEAVDIETTSEPETLTTQSVQTVHQPTPPKRKRKKAERMTYIEPSAFEKLYEKDNRHISFCKAILPSIQTFSDTETIQFQCQVLNAIQDIQRAREINTQVWSGFSASSMQNNNNNNNNNMPNDSHHEHSIWRQPSGSQMSTDFDSKPPQPDYISKSQSDFISKSQTDFIPKSQPVTPYHSRSEFSLSSEASSDSETGHTETSPNSHGSHGVTIPTQHFLHDSPHHNSNVTGLSPLSHASTEDEILELV